MVELKVTLDSSFKTSLQAGPARKKSKGNAAAAADDDGSVDVESFRVVRLVSNKNGRPPFPPETIVYNVFSSDDYQVHSKVFVLGVNGDLIS